MKILNVISSPRGERSVSTKLGKSIIERLVDKNQGSEIITRDLNVEPYPHIVSSHLDAFFTPPEKRSDKDKEMVVQSDVLIKEVLDSDVIVISVPMWNFSVPSVLKAWIDHISRAGITFTYTDKGPVGLIKNKKVFIALASGGIYSQGPAKAMDFVEPYLSGLLRFLGIQDITVYRVEGLSIPGVMETAFENALMAIREEELAA